MAYGDPYDPLDDEAFLAAMAGTQFAGTGVPDIFGPISNPIPPPPPPPPQRIGLDAQGLPPTFPDDEPPGWVDEVARPVYEEKRAAGQAEPELGIGAVGLEPDGALGMGTASLEGELPLPPEEVDPTPAEFAMAAQDDPEAPFQAPELLDPDETDSTELEQAFYNTQDPAYGMRDLENRARQGVEAQLATRDSLADKVRHEQAYLSATEKARRMTEEINAKAQELANVKIDRGRWWSSRTTGQKIAAIISAAIGGWYSHETGGRNTGLELILARINEDVEDQKSQHYAQLQGLQAQRSSVGDMLAAEQDVYKAAEVKRIASLDMVMADIQTEMAQFDPRGARVAEMTKLLQGLSAERQAALKKAYADSLDMGIKEAELINKQLDADTKAKKLRGGTGTGGKLSPAELQTVGQAQPPASVLANSKKYEEWLDLSGKHASFHRGQEQATAAARENAPVADLVTEDGEPVTFRNAGASEEIAKKKAAVDNITNLIDQLIIARTKHGWSSDLLKSDEWRKAQALQGSLIIEGKNVAELGALSGPDMELITKTLGTNDPTEMRDPIAGWKQARANAVSNLNAAVQSRAVLPKGKKPRRYEPARTEPAQATERSFQQNLDILDSELLNAEGVDETVRGKALQRALDSVDAAAFSAEDPNDVRKLGVVLRKRIGAGQFPAETVGEVTKRLRRRFKERVVMTPGLRKLTDKQIDQYLGLEEDKE